MANDPERRRPAQPLSGYRDIGGDDVSHNRPALVRAWIILAILMALYLGWTLVVYFLEPGLR
jgi:hypothetical protein